MMKRIANFYTPKLSQQQAFRFFKKVGKRMMKFEDEKFRIIYQDFQSANNDFELALKSIPSNLIAENIGIENQKRMKALSTIRELCGELLINETSHFKAIAEKLDSILLSMDIPQHISDNEKTILINKLIKEIESKINIAELYELDIFNQISELKRANWAYTHFVHARRVEVKGTFLTYETLRTRKAVENTYQRAVEFINAMAIYFGDIEFADTIDHINRIIDEVKTECSEDVHRSIPA